MSKKKSYDLSTLMQIGNLCLGILAWVLFYQLGPNQYVDIQTILLASYNSIQNILILVYEKRNRDPFIVILLLNNSLFYMVRVISLIYDPWSLVLFRYELSVTDLNYSFLFVIIANIAIVLGLISTRGSILFGKSTITYKKVNKPKYKASKSNLVLFILLISLVFSHLSRMSIGLFGLISGYLAGTILNPFIVMLFTIVYTTVYYKYLSKRYKITLLLIFVVFMLASTIMGSRSAIITLLIPILFAVLSTKNNITISKRGTFAAFILIPLSFLLFMVATFLRGVGDYNPKTVVDSERISYLNDFAIFEDDDNVKLIFRPIFDRIGMLTYATDIIANSEKYDKYVNINYYLKSIVDNGLSPGFSVFDAPRAANMIRFIFTDAKDKPTHKDVIAEYSSDILTLYGEYYTLFGPYFALVFLFISSHIFKRIYMSVKNKNLVLFHLYRAFILYNFYSWLETFGWDWIIVNLIYFLLPILLLKNLYIVSDKRLNYDAEYGKI